MLTVTTIKVMVSRHVRISRCKVSQTCAKSSHKLWLTSTFLSLSSIMHRIRCRTKHWTTGSIFIHHVPVSRLKRITKHWCPHITNREYICSQLPASQLKEGSACDSVNCLVSVQVQNLLTRSKCTSQWSVCSQIHVRVPERTDTLQKHTGNEGREAVYQNESKNAEGFRITTHRRKKSSEADTIDISLIVGRRNSDKSMDDIQVVHNQKNRTRKLE